MPTETPEEREAAAVEIAATAYDYANMNREELIAALKNETHDSAWLSGAATDVYYHVTGGRVSNPMTSPEAVIAEADAFVEQEIEAAREPCCEIVPSEN